MSDWVGSFLDPESAQKKKGAKSINKIDDLEGDIKEKVFNSAGGVAESLGYKTSDVKRIEFFKNGQSSTPEEATEVNFVLEYKDLLERGDLRRLLGHPAFIDIGIINDNWGISAEL